MIQGHTGQIESMEVEPLMILLFYNNSDAKIIEGGEAAL
jgi:hypothetical protein